ncbi:MAG: S49 family peptidase [Pirellulaceae bacterium]|nr:S49 family peptidase [Pirellulaceae bacterium]
MRLVSLLVLLIACMVGCQRRPFLMRGAMNVDGNMRMNGDMNMTGGMAMTGDMTTSMKTDNTASPLSPVALSGYVGHGAKVAVVDLDGVIVDRNITGIGSMGENPVALFREKLNAIAADTTIDAVVLRINSPGGGVTASDIVSHDLIELKRKRNLPVVACLMTVGTGGGYYLATHADSVVAHPTSVVGGIGVIMNVYNMEDTMGQFNILSNPIKAGEQIDAGTPERPMGIDERKRLQSIADAFHDRFIDQVRQSRSSIDANEDLFDGRVFTGDEAQSYGLVDHVGYLNDAIIHARQLAGGGPTGPVVMLRRDNDRAYTTLDVTPNSPLNTSLVPFKLPGLDRSSMPTFLYLWQPDSSLASVIQ